MDRQGQEDIRDISRECDQLFTRFVQENRPGRVAIETSQQQFWAWLHAFNVFSKQNLPLDSHLRKEQSFQTRQLVMLLLGVLKENLRLALQPIQETKKMDASDKNTTSPYYTSSALDIALFGIDGSLKRLEKIVFMIDTDGVGSLARQVFAYAGEDRNEGFEQHVAQLLQSWLQPDISSGLGKLIFASLLHRHYRILHERKMDRTNEFREKKSLESLAESSLAQEVFSARSTLQRSTNFLGYFTVGQQYHSSRSRSSSQTSYTSTVDTKSHSSKSRSSSQTSYTSTVDTKSHSSEAQSMSQPSFVSTPERRLSDLDQYMAVSSVSKTVNVQYPEPPVLTSGQKEALCPICQKPCEAEVFRGVKWRSHVDQDLKPYVCISQNCSKNLLFFADSTSWIQHMRQVHTTMWIRHLHNDVEWKCALSHPGNVIHSYRTEKGLLEHMKAEHKGLYKNDEELQNLAGSGRVPIPRPLNTCPICGQEHEQTSHKTDDSDHGSDLKSSAHEKRSILAPGQLEGKKLPSESEAGFAVTPEICHHQRVERYIEKHLKALAYYFSIYLIESPDASLPEFWDPSVPLLDETPNQIPGQYGKDEKWHNRLKDRLRRKPKLPEIREEDDQSRAPLTSWARESFKEGPYFPGAPKRSTSDVRGTVHRVNGILQYVASR